MEVGGAQGVCRVGGALGERADQGAQGLRVALVGQGFPHRLPQPRRDGVRPARRQRPASGPGAVVQRSEHGVEQRPQGVGAFGA
ncbi:hypothetical protein SVIOM74S_09118 [Streptomyces violarus]